MGLDASFGPLLIFVLLLIFLGPPLFSMLSWGIMRGTQDAVYPADSRRIAWRIGFMMQLLAWTVALLGRNHLSIFGDSYLGYALAMGVILLPGALIAIWKGLGSLGVRFHKAILTTTLLSTGTAALMLSGTIAGMALAMLMVLGGAVLVYVCTNAAIDWAYATSRGKVVVIVLWTVVLGGIGVVHMLYDNVPAVTRIGYVRANTLLHSDLAYYAPKHYNGPLQLSYVSSNLKYHNLTPELTMTYDLNHGTALYVTITRKTDAFDPPRHCAAKTATEGICKWVLTTKHGRQVYGYRSNVRIHTLGADAQPNLITHVQPQTFYVVFGNNLLEIDNTAISGADDNTSNITPQLMDTFIDSLVPYRGNDLGPFLKRYYVEF